MSMLIALLLATGTVAAPQPDPFVPLRKGAQIDRLAIKALLNKRGAENAIQRWLHRHSDVSEADRAMLLHRVCQNYGLIPDPTDHDAWAHFRRPMDMMRQG